MGPIIVIYEFFLKIGIFLKNLNHVDIGVKIFVSAAAWAKLPAAAGRLGSAAACSTDVRRIFVNHVGFFVLESCSNVTSLGKYDNSSY